MKLLVVLVIFLLWNETQGQKCPQLKRKLDICVRESLVSGDYPFVPPKNMQDMDVFCEKRRPNLKCLIGYKKCVKAFPKQMLSIIITGFKNLYKNTCSSAGKIQFLEASRCLSPTNLKDVHQIMEKNTVAFKYIATNATDEQLLPYTCCGYHQTLRLIEDTFRNICSPAETDPKIPKIWSSYMVTGFGDAVGLGCGQYSDISACERRLPRLMAHLKSIADRKVDPEEFTFVPDLIAIAERLAN